MHQVLHDPVLQPFYLRCPIQKLKRSIYALSIVVVDFVGTKRVTETVSRSITGGLGVLDCAKRGAEEGSVGVDELFVGGRGKCHGGRGDGTMT
jgi:hypothetical protein